MTRPGLLALVLALAAGVTGCQPSYRARGDISSAGPNPKDNWRSTPQGCTRDPFDGQPPDKTRSIVTFVWEDPDVRDPTADNAKGAPDAPMRLEFSRVDAGPEISATLHTRYKAGIPLDSHVCSELHLTTHEQPAQPPATRPSLAGEFSLDCQAGGNHIAASVRFQGCDY